MSKKLSFLLGSFLLAALPLCVQANEETPQTHAASFEPFTGQVSGSKVRIRTQPNLEAHVVRETVHNELFAVVSEDRDFYAIVPPKSMKGYVFRTFVLDNVVEGERVNVRLHPDIDAPVIAQLNTGDKIQAAVCETNNKWLEIELPRTCHFYIAKEFLEKKGPIEYLAQMEKKQIEGTHKLSSAFLFAQSEIQKPFEQIDLDSISQKFEELTKEFCDILDISDKAKEANTLIQDIYVQKKIAFLESKADKSPKHVEIDPSLLEKLAKLGIDLKSTSNSRDNQLAKSDKNLEEVGQCAAETVGLSSLMGADEITDKMLVWQPLEESLYHLWAAANGEKSIQEFYEEEKDNAISLTGIVEPYNRPVKNRPGDFILRSENLPVAFLYSTKINLEKLSGKKISLIVSPRPNNNFAFPAYYVLSIE